MIVCQKLFICPLQPDSLKKQVKEKEDEEIVMKI